MCWSTTERFPCLESSEVARTRRSAPLTSVSLDSSRLTMLQLIGMLSMSFNLPSLPAAPRTGPVSGTGHASRRDVLSLGGAAAALIVATPRAAHASLDPNDMSRFKKALTGVNYLLDNWSKETTECTSSGEGICNDSPDKVRYYYGLRTTDHPLFQLDKLYAKAQNQLPDDVDFEVWIEATESLASQIAKINELAYT